MNKRETNPALRKALLLGHSGFIGSHLASSFEKHSPDIELTGRSLPDFDLTDPAAPERLSGLLDEHTVVIMLSAIKRQFADDIEAFNSNLSMVMNLCRALRSRPAGRMIYLSSAAVYGEDIHNTAITENTPVCPTSFYGTAKFAAERLLWKTCAGVESCSLLVLRPPTVYGPGDMGNTYGPAGFIKAAIANEPVTLWGEGDELRDFVFVEDMAEIIRHLALGSHEGVLNIATGKSCSFREMLDIIVSLTSKQIVVNSRPRTKQKVDNVFVNKRLRSVLPRFVFTDMRAGISRMMPG